MFWLVVDIHWWDIGSLYRPKQQRHAPGSILKMSVNWASTIFSFASWVSCVPIGCRHPLMRYWQPILATTTATCYLRHPEDECQRSINSFRTSIICNLGIVRNIACITVLLTALVGKNTIYWTWNTDTKLIDIAKCSTSKSTLLVAENAILLRYYAHTANT